MTQSKTETIETVHGDVSYETVECSSCGTETKKDMAADYLVGRIDGVTTRYGKKRYRFDEGTLQRGHLCPHCVDAGPMNSPGAPSIHATLIEKIKDADLFILALSVGVMLAFMFLGLSVLLGGLIA